jgi:hypothetical protein
MQQNKVIARKPNREEIKQKIHTVKAITGSVMGYLVYWSMSAFRIQHDEFKKRLEACGIDPKDYGKKATEKSYATQAVKEQTKGKRKFHRSAEDKEGNRTVFAIVDEQIDKATDFHHSQESKISFNKETKKIDVEGSYKQEIETRFEEFKGTFNTEQFRNMVLRYIENTCQGVSIRDKGGCYFVPVTTEAEMEKMQKLFGMMDGCDIECLPQYDAEAIKKAMWKAVTADIKFKMDNFNKDLDALQGKEVSDKVIQNRLDEAKEIAGMLEMYEVLLTSTARDLKGDIKQIEKRVGTLIRKATK